MAYNISNAFPLPVDYVIDNTGSLLKNGVVEWHDFVPQHVSFSDNAVYDEAGNLDRCVICLDALNPTTTIGNFESAPDRDQDHLLVKNTHCQHIFHLGCFSGLMEAGNKCHICRQQFVNTKEEVERYHFVSYALDQMAAGSYDQAHGMTEHPVLVDAQSLVQCLLLTACFLRLADFRAPPPWDEGQYAPRGVADHADGRRIEECLLEAACRRDNHHVKIDAFIEQLPSRAATILRQQHPNVAYTQGMWRFCSEVASLGLRCYAAKHNMKDHS